MNVYLFSVNYYYTCISEKMEVNQTTLNSKNTDGYIKKIKRVQNYTKRNEVLRPTS